ncbi:MAG: hypothetical protein AAGH92_10675 [Planctomycetota bacterium]
MVNLIVVWRNFDAANSFVLSVTQLSRTPHEIDQQIVILQSCVAAAIQNLWVAHICRSQYRVGCRGVITIRLTTKQEIRYRHGHHKRPRKLPRARFRRRRIDRHVQRLGREVLDDREALPDV